MNETQLIDQALTKFPKAKRVAVENFTMGSDNMDMATEMNLEMDRGLYNWNPNTVSAIRWVINQKAAGALKETCHGCGNCKCGK